MHAGVKSLLAGNQQAAVTVAVEGLMDAKANAEADSFVTIDPKVCGQRQDLTPSCSLKHSGLEVTDKHVHVSHKDWQVSALCQLY